MFSRKPAILFLLTIVVSLSGCKIHSPYQTKRNVKHNTILAKTVDIKSDKSTSRLPWINDADFVSTYNQLGRPRLIASYSASLPDPILNERYNIALGATYLKGKILIPNQIFSLDQAIGPRTKERGFKKGPMYSGDDIVATYGGGICKLASVLYNLAVLSDLLIVERHAHSMTVPYVPPGQDATISYMGKNLRLKNATGKPFLLWAKNVDDTLYMAFYGDHIPPKVEWIHVRIRETRTWVEYRKEKSLHVGQQKVVYEGTDGVVVHSWIIKTKDGESRKIDMGISAYSPCPKIVAVGVKK